MGGVLRRARKGFSVELQVLSCLSCLCNHEKCGGN